MPAELKREELLDVTMYPLLNYLVALSYRRGRLNFQEETNRNAIYADLLDAVYDKRWGGGNPYTEKLEHGDFTGLLENISLAVWHGNGRTAPLATITGYCGGSDNAVLKQFTEGAESGVLRLLTAFYFRRTSGQGEETFEFTHKSFGEYLTARRIVRALEEIHQDLNPSRKRLSSEKLEENALVEWARVCGPTALDPAILNFLRDEIALRDRAELSDAPATADLQQMLCDLIAVMLRNGMPMHHTDLDIKTFGEMNRQAIHAELALLATLDACARVTRQTSNIEWSKRTEENRWEASNVAREWFRRLSPLDDGSGSYVRGSRSQSNTIKYFHSNENTKALDCLGRLNLSKCALMAVDFIGAELEASDLAWASLSGAILNRANLRFTDLTHARLWGTDLTQADLTEANLTAGRMQAAKLREAQLHNANLQQAELHDADLRGANLYGANLDQAYLAGADLRDVKGLDSTKGLMTSRNFDKALIDEKHQTTLLAEWKRNQPKSEIEQHLNEEVVVLEEE